MADISDVENALVAFAAQVLYPNGTGQPSVANADCLVHPGWPTPAQLDADLAAGKAHVVVFPFGDARNTTRYQPKAQTVSTATATLTLTATGNVVTVGGAMPSPFTAHNIAVIVKGVPFVYPAQPADTLTSIATGLAALLVAAFPGTISNGKVVTLPAGINPVVRVGTTSMVATEWERQEQRIMLAIMVPNPTLRATVSAQIKAAFAQIAFLTMPDGFGARVRANGDRTSDDAQREKLYRRDLFFDVEYATTVTGTATQVIAVKPSITNQ